MSTLLSFDTTLNSYGTSVSYGSLNSSFYTSNGLSAGIWNLSLSIPSLLPKDYALMSFDSASNDYGISVQESALIESFFTTNGLSNTIWFLNTTRPTLRFKDYTLLSFDSVPNNYSVNITGANARKQASYPTFSFGTPWAIIEDVTYPYILSFEGDINDPPLTTRKVYVFIAEDVEGSLFHEGKVYKSLKKTISHNSITGTAGQTVTHVYGGAKLNDADALPYVFAFSGVQDPARPGGYGDIQDLTERTVTLLADRSNNAAFYYKESVAPAYDYLLSIQGNSMVFHIAVFLTDVSEIKVVMGDGSIAYVGLVPVDDPEASLIRVLTLDGIFALQGVEGVEQPAPMMSMMFAAPAPYVTETEYRITYPRTGAISTVGKTGSSIFAAPFIANGGDIREVSLHGKKREEGADIRIAIAKDLNNKPDMTKILYQGSSRMFPIDMSKMTEQVNDIPTMNGETLWLMFDARDSVAGAGDAGTAADGHSPFKYSNDNGVTWLTHTSYLAMDVLLVTKTVEGEV